MASSVPLNGVDRQGSGATPSSEFDYLKFSEIMKITTRKRVTLFYKIFSDFK